ncbi:MAG: hypothetical protein LBB91_03260 [Clostridiales bacterium]|jgi:hypothetical protein|nr:hypothetical protein [Clostridiales bacterium]
MPKIENYLFLSIEDFAHRGCGKTAGMLILSRFYRAAWRQKDKKMDGKGFVLGYSFTSPFKAVF